MGIGDELMAIGQAQHVARSQGAKKVAVRGADGRQRWHELFERAPEIAKIGDGFAAEIVNGPGARPYIADKNPTRWTWKDFRPLPARLVLTYGEQAFGARHAGFIIIEPTTKAKASPNKAYPADQWAEVVATMQRERLPLAQVGPPGTLPLPGVRLIETPTFLHAAAVLERSWAYLGHEGGLHHAAAAARIPAVVLMGGYISPAQTGYDLPSHRYLVANGKACGSRVPCPHCAEAMRMLTPATVVAALKEVITT